MVRRILRVLRRLLFDAFGIRIDIHPNAKIGPLDNNRFAYQQKYVQFDVKRGDRVLDIGSGGSPFPYATVLADRFAGAAAGRREPLVTNNKPLVLADIHRLPFTDKAFDYVYSAHLLEMVDDPLQACREVMRVGKRGYIETPTAAKDVLFAWARGIQKWQVVSTGRCLCFFEYSDRELDGIRSPVWRDLVFSQRHNEVQQVFRDNQDIFNVMFVWNERFPVFVFRLDGSIQTLNVDLNASAGRIEEAEAYAS